jgi:hypothetical protein
MPNPETETKRAREWKKKNKKTKGQEGEITARNETKKEV